METKSRNFPYIFKNTCLDNNWSEILFPFHLCAALWRHFPFRTILFAFCWYREDMDALVSRWRKAVDEDGDCVEK